MKEKLIHELNLCGCIEEEEVFITIRGYLSWAAEPIDARVMFVERFTSLGSAYLILNMLENLGYIEHGSAIRCPWLTEKGKVLLTALRESL